MSDPSIPTFESERLTFVPIMEAHAHWTQPILADEKLYTWMPATPPELTSLKTRYSFWESRRSPDGKELWWNWVIGLKSVDDEPQVLCLGTLQVGIDRASQVATLAYIIGSGFQRNGYATEAVLSLLDLLRNKGVHQVMAWVDTRNVASIRLLDKVGLTPIDRIENADFFKGSQSDEWIYSCIL